MARYLRWRRAVQRSRSDSSSSNIGAEEIFLLRDDGAWQFRHCVEDLGVGEPGCGRETDPPPPDSFLEKLEQPAAMVAENGFGSAAYAAVVVLLGVLPALQVVEINGVHGPPPGKFRFAGVPYLKGPVTPHRQVERPRSRRGWVLCGKTKDPPLSGAGLRVVHYHRITCSLRWRHGLGCS